MAKLFEPLTLQSITVKNRIVVSPMCEYSSEDGFANDWHLVHLGSRAVGGAGLIITEACAVSPEGRISAADLGIWKDAHVAALQPVTAFLKKHGAVPGIQLAHAGRKASCAEPWNGGQQISINDGGWQVVAPSPVPFKEGTMLPVALDQQGIDQVIRDFTDAAKRAVDAGFELIEIHAAHGYLIHQFLSPLSNLRTDAYGGSFENRVKILLQIVEGMKTVWPSHLPIIVRISATDWVEGGWDLHDSIKLSLLLKEAGVSLIDCSTGGNVGQVKIPVGPGYQVPFAKGVKQGADILTGAVGLITGAAQAETILENGEADLIFIAREFLRDPYFALNAAATLQQDVAWPVQYERAKK